MPDVFGETMNWHAWGWPQVEGSSFEEYLKCCPDYLRTVKAGEGRYRFRHNDMEFAHVQRLSSGQEIVFVKPELLNNSLTLVSK